MAHGGHETVELIAALVLVIGGGVFMLGAFLARRGRSGAARAGMVGPDLRAGDVEVPPLRRSLALVLAGLSAGAAVIHLVAAPTHYVELGDLGAGFLVAAAFQAAWIRWCLAGPSARAAIVGIAGNVAIVAAWAYTRLVGLPIGPFAGSPEPVGFPDGASVAFELVLVAGLLVTLADLDLRGAGRRALREVASIAVVPIVGLVIVLTSLATVAIASGLDHGTGGHPAGEHAAAP